MEEAAILGLALIIILGISAQIISWHFKLPSILLLLIFGFLAGPVFNYINPDQLLGDLLFPIISISVAIILFEGGLSLKFSEIPGLRALIFNLITIGVLATWIIVTLASYYILSLSLDISILLGAVLTVTGPTVIIPLLRHIKPKAPLGAVLKWEGILVDPVGAILAVLVFESIYHGSLDSSTSFVITGLLYTLIISFSIGTIGAYVLSKIIKNYYVPDYLQNPFSLALVILVHVTSNHLQPESGLMSVTIMGVILANIGGFTVKHILEFKENLRVLLISCLFIILSARMDIDEILNLDPINAGIFLLIVIFIARPFSVFLSSVGSELKFSERTFLSFVAPRGIVAAAVASLFSLKLAPIYPEATLIGSYVFMIIIGTVIFYGFLSTPIARLLNLSQKEANGILILGASKLGIEMAKEISKLNKKVLLVDTNARNVYLAMKNGLDSVHGNILDAFEEKKIDLQGIGKLLALTPNHEANSIASLHFSDEFERSNVFQLAPGEGVSSATDSSLKHLRGRLLFNKNANYYHLDDLLHAGAKIRTIDIYDSDAFKKLQTKYSDKFIPLFFVTPENDLEVICTETTSIPEANWKIIALLLDPSV